eukprot:331649_1
MIVVYAMMDLSVMMIHMDIVKKDFLQFFGYFNLYSSVYLFFNVYGHVVIIKKKTAEKTKPSNRSNIAKQHIKFEPIPSQQTPVPETPTPITNNNNEIPKGWIKCYTPDGKIYYQNNVTQVTQWEIPTQPAEPDTQPGEEPLPDGWVEITTPDGKIYYQNNKTKNTQWERPIQSNTQQVIVPANTQKIPVTAVTVPTTTNNNNNNDCDWESIDYNCGAFIEFPFSTTCKNYLIRLLCCFASMASFLFAYLLPSCCPTFYDSDYSAPDCCSWYGTNYFIYIFSWILFVWYCISGLWLIVVKKQEMTWISSSSYTSGNYEYTTTTVSTSSSICYNIFMLILQAGILCFAMVILPATMGGDRQNYYC